MTVSTVPATNRPAASPGALRKLADIERKMLREVLPYLASAKELAKARAYRAYGVHDAINGILLGITGFGAGGGLKAFAEGEGKGFFEAIAGLPLWMQVPAIAAFISWCGLVLVVRTTKMHERGPHIHSLLQWMEKLERRMHRALEERNPMPKLLEVQQAISATVDRAEQEGLWPWTDRIAPSADEAAGAVWVTLKSRHEETWKL